MKKGLKVTLIVLASLILAGGALAAGWFAGGMRAARVNARTDGTVTTTYGYPGMMGGRETREFGGMMGGRTTRQYGGMMGTQDQDQDGTYGYPGMMGGRGGQGYGGMMQGFNTQANLTPLTVEQATQAAQTYIDSLSVSGFQIAEVVIFDNNAYVRVVEQSTGIGAFELLVDPVSVTAFPEMGANMMWNLKYGGLNRSQMMGGRSGMMGATWDGSIPEVSATMTVTPEQALADAQAYLDSAQPGTTAATSADPFYGYYTVDVLKDGKLYGMLSVNGTSGEVFYHFWHGTFIEMSESK